jgi:O-acetyl-ADP-ribose deacetylase (regulator of RNase III)
VKPIETAVGIAPPSPFSFASTIWAAEPSGRRFGTPQRPELQVVVGDLSQETSDAVVNPAGAGLVDLALRRAAGPGLLEAFHQGTAELPVGRLGRGQAIVTQGFRLPARHVIHCGPPIYADGSARAREDLTACHVEALRLARDRGFTSVSFPAIATGVYRFPVEQAAELAVRTIVAELRARPAPGLVRIVLFDRPTFRVYAEAARAYLDECSTLEERETIFSAAG